VLEVLYHHAKFGGARISPASGAAKNVEYFCLFVCYRQHIARSATCRYLIYSEADFPCDICCMVPSSMPNFTPIGATVRV